MILSRSCIFSARITSNSRNTRTVQIRAYSADHDLKEVTPQITPDDPDMVHAILKQHSKPSITITAKPVKETTQTPWQSKFGGIPYLPKERSIPLNSEGNQLTMIAQLNLDDINALQQTVSEEDRVQSLPESGLLQFFIDMSSPHRGSKNVMGSKIVFHDEVVRDMGALETGRNLPPQIIKTWPLAFASGIACDLDFEIAKSYPNNTNYLTRYIADSRLDYLSPEALDPPRHIPFQIGGFPWFEAKDPRDPLALMELLGQKVPKALKERPKTKFPALELASECLLQMNSFKISDDAIVDWDSNGSAHFFVAPKLIKKRSFTDALFHWDNNKSPMWSNLANEFEKAQEEARQELSEEAAEKLKQQKSLPKKKSKKGKKKSKQ